MTTAAIPSTTTWRDAVVRHSRHLKDVLRFARSRAGRKQDDEYTRSLAKSVLSSERSKCIEQVVSLVLDVAKRGTIEDAESIGHALVAIARAEWAASHTNQPARLSVEEAHLIEERTEGDVEQAETAMAHHPGSLTHYLAYLRTAAVHTAARRDLDDAVRRSAARAS